MSATASHLRILLFRLVVCLVAPLAISALLAIIRVPQDRALSAALNLYLIVVLAVSIRWGTRYAIAFSLFSTIAFSWGLQPAGSFHLRDIRVWTLFTACLVTGVVAGQLSRRVRKEALNAERRRAEAEAEHARFVDLVNSVEGIVWEADAHTFNFSFVSGQAERVLGYPVERWLSEPAFWLDHLHAQDRDWVQQFCRESSAQKHFRDCEYRMVAADGHAVWLRDLATVVVENGEVTRLRGVMVDISTRKEAEEAARRSEKELRDVVAAIPAMAFAIRPDGSTEFVNKRWLEYSGMSAEDSSGAGWASTVHPDDRDEHMKKWGASLSSGEPFENEVRHRSGRGDYRWFLVRAVPLRDDKGTLQKWYGTLTDIEDRKRAEQALRQSERNLAEAQRMTHSGSFIWDIKTKQALYLSAEWYRIYGFDPDAPPAAAMAQNNSIDLFLPRVTFEASAWEERKKRIHPEDRNKWETAIDRAIREKADYEVEFRVILPDGREKWIGAIGHPVLNEAGEPVQFTGTVTDITERVRAEQERERLRQLEADLAHINRVSVMGELAASLGHEIKQPLAAAITNANTCLRWLKRDVPDLEEARSAASRVAEDARRAAEIINRTSSLYKKGTAHRESIHVNEVIEEIVALFRHEAGRHSVLIRRELASDLPTVIADRVQLQQVLMNLLINSIDELKRDHSAVCSRR
jgi:PAS domain S-box-containing protein